MTKTPSREIQVKAVNHVNSYMEVCRELMSTRRQVLLEVYKAWIKFKGERQSKWATEFKLNKAHQVVETVLPRIIGRNPKWIVSARENWQASEEENASSRDHALAIQDYLTYVFDEYNLSDMVRLWGKNMIVYGKGYAKVKFKYEIYRDYVDVEEEETDEEGMPILGEDGNPAVKLKRQIEEDVYGEHPTIDVKNWSDIYYDPRYINLEDRPGIIEELERVPFDQLNNDDYFNLDKVKEIAMLKVSDSKEYERQVLNIAGICNISGADRLKLSSLNVRKFYGKFNEGTDVTKEKLYELCVVNETILVSMKEITEYPFEEIKCFEDVETANARGFVEPIISLQDEMNFKKNSASEYVNRGMNRQVIWSPNSGIDPKTINDPIIVTTADAVTAQNNFIELGWREINPSFFQEQNDFERQIQGMTFTVDTANQQNQQALTNTATGIRVKFFESNSVLDEIRKRLENGVSRIGYKLLKATFENMDDNISIKKMGSEGYWNINKEALRNAARKYSIRIEANSTSADYIEDRQEEKLAILNMLIQAKSQGVNVNVENAIRDYLSEREGLDPNRYIMPPSVAGIASQLGIGGQGGMPLSEPVQGAQTPAQVTESVAGTGGIQLPNQ